MKKTAAAVAAALMSAAAGAADITLYGVVDTGFVYTNTDTLTTGTDESFQMMSGFSSGSRIGFKGTEELGNGYAVSFILENGFSVDTGVLGQSGRMFGRESSLKLHTPYGMLAFGRAGSLVSASGSMEVFGTYADALPGGWSEIFNLYNYQGSAERYDNLVTYKSPTAAGFTGYAQYSFANNTKSGDDDALPNERSNNRYATAGLTYANGPLQAVVIYDTTMFKHESTPAANVGDNRNLSLGGSYDFGFMRVSAYAQYVKGARTAYTKSIWTSAVPRDADGWNFHLGTQVPVSWGRLYAAAYWGKLDYNEIAGDGDMRNLNVLLATDYSLSKRTTLYTGLAYRQVKAEVDNAKEVDEKTTQAVVGMRHRF